MHYLVMRQRQDIILGTVIAHRKRQLIVVIFSEVWVKLHIFTVIVHPSHIPLEGETKSSILRIGCYFRPGRRLLGNRHDTGMCTVNNGIQVLEKLNRIKVFIAAVLVCNPLSVLLAIVKIKHGSHSVHSESVDVELPYPEQCICNEEIANLIFAVVKYLCTPVRMLTKSRVRMLIQTSTIKLTQTMCIPWKMSRNPVKNDTNVIFVQQIN